MVILKILPFLSSLGISLLKFRVVFNLFFVIGRVWLARSQHLSKIFACQVSCRAELSDEIPWKFNHQEQHSREFQGIHNIIFYIFNENFDFIMMSASWHQFVRTFLFEFEEEPLRSNKIGRFEKLLGFARSQFILL